MGAFPAVAGQVFKCVFYDFFLLFAGLFFINFFRLFGLVFCDFFELLRSFIFGFFRVFILLVFYFRFFDFSGHFQAYFCVFLPFPDFFFRVSGLRFFAFVLRAVFRLFFALFFIGFCSCFRLFLTAPKTPVNPSGEGDCFPFSC